MDVWKNLLAFPCVVVLAGAVAGRAEEATKPVDAAASEKQITATAEAIAALVEQLDANSYAERSAASEKLLAIGAGAIPALAKAAKGESLEATVRSIEILQELAGATNKATGESAKTALKQIAECNVPAASRRAKDALKSLEDDKRPAGADAIQRQPGGGIRIQRAAGGMQIQLGGAGGGFRRVVLPTGDGGTRIIGSDGDTQVEIVKDAVKGITMKVTTKKDGKDTTEKYAAKNAEELKQKHPKAYEIFEKFDRNPAKINPQIQRLAQAQRPAQLPNAPQARGAVRGFTMLDLALRMLPRWNESLKRLANKQAIEDAPPEACIALKKQVTQMRRDLADLEKQLQEKIDKAAGDADADEPKEKPAPAQDGDGAEPK